MTIILMVIFHSTMSIIDHIRVGFFVTAQKVGI